MKGRDGRVGRWLAGAWAQAPLGLAAASLLATAVLVWTGSRAAYDLHDRTELVLRQATDQTLALLVERLAREMRGAQLLIQPMGGPDLDREHVDELIQTFDAGLDAYPYVDAFFGWIDEPRGNQDMTVVSRTDRGVTLVAAASDAPQRPAASAAASATPAHPTPSTHAAQPAQAMQLTPPSVPSPPAPPDDDDQDVRVTHDATLGRWLIDEVAAVEHAPYRRGVRLFERTIDGHRYQFVVRLFFRGPQRAQLFGIIGYAIDLDWVRAGYFATVLEQFSAPDAHRLNPIVATAIRDERGRVLASRGPAMQAATSRARRFPLAFLDADRLYIASPRHAPVPEFEAVVGLADRSASAAATRIAADTHRILWVAACAILLTVILFVRLLRRQAELVALRESFVSRVTHELKTPLSLIKLAVETLQLRRVPAEKIDEYYDLLQKETTRLERLINSVLRFAQRDLPRRELAFQPLDVRELVRETLARLEMQLHEAGFRVVVSLDEALPVVWADATAMEDVFDNLVQNAIKFSPHERALTWSGRRVDGFVEIHLTDRGVGIPADDGTRIFEPFVRGRDVTAPGHGLGLAIVRQVMAEHGGYIKVDSPADGGTTFIVGLPVARAAAAGLPSRSARKHA